ncbi:MAG TPA: cell division FtsA domain-containing protein [Clostridia bacterium]|nr:cell division FtsA domain-containing protein [Clostridia bacterium]
MSKNTGSKLKKTEKNDKKSSRIISLANKDKRPAELLSGISQEELIFALDIGTRTVIGVVGVQEDNCFRVIATDMTEHKNRAMLDGQIHDIEQVAQAAAEVKQKLETKLGIKLKRVAIAAAGRVLKTCQVKVEKNIEAGHEIDSDLVSSLEIEGIQRAQMMLDEEMSGEDKTQFYCVGYSVINYYLNNFVISKLTGHKGKTVAADILATFLPIIVVESLYTVMGKIGLEVSSLTLEPIAAINVTIPADLRLLNLVLVDIGAGTSDIALTRDGSVIAYAMVPIAGDEITEKISQNYLVDFNTGEKIKIALSSGRDTITFTDILKKKQTVAASEVYSTVEDTVEQLAATISQKIIEFNRKPPNAVFLVGGGSRIPGLPEMLAHQLGLATDRVVVRGRDVIRDIKFNDKKLSGPESITPYGIAVTAQMYGGKDFLSVTVNDKKIRLFNSKKLTVADALILFGYDAGSLIGRSGKGMTFSVDGEVRHVRGQYGKAAEIFVNGKQSSLDTPIFYADSIKVVPAQDGDDAEVLAYELVSSFSEGVVKLNGNPIDISTTISVNGRHAERETRIKDGDAVQITQIRTLGELLEAGGYAGSKYNVLVNGRAEADDYILADKDQVECTEPESISADKPADLYNDSSLKPQDIEDEFVKEPEGIVFTDNSAQSRAGVAVSVNGSTVVLDGNRAQYIFVDIFNHINFDLTKPQGTIVLKLNGQQASFTDVIRSGDVIEIYWKK